MGKRFVDDGRTIYAFIDLFLVRCTRCQRCARIFTLTQENLRLSGFARRRLTCGHCAFTRDWPDETGRRAGVQNEFQYTVFREPFDWYFRLPLWLQTPCCGHTLFAYNAEHLSFLEEFVAADLREVARHRNQSLASRLPQWVQNGHNRAEVLRGIGRLRTLLRDA